MNRISQPNLPAFLAELNSANLRLGHLEMSVVHPGEIVAATLVTLW